MSARLIASLVAVALVVAVSGCGSDAEKGPPGSVHNPVAAQHPATDTSESGAAVKPNYGTLLERQKAAAPTAGKSQNPCALVTKAQAQKILGGKLLDPVSLPQGPTCIYRSRSNQRFATLSVQAQDFALLRKQLHRAQRVQVASHRAYCGVYGRPMLYLPLSGNRVLSVAAPCDTAVAFARKARTQLTP
jgi:hypothetical protein